MFPADEARRLTQRFEVHYTPPHASWLNMAEIEIGIFERGCLRRPVSSGEVLRQHIAALEAERHTPQATIHGRFTTGDARVRRASLYPKREQVAPSLSNI